MERGTLLTAISYQRTSPSPTSEGVRPGVLSKGREGKTVLPREATRRQWKCRLLPGGAPRIQSMCFCLELVLSK